MEDKVEGIKASDLLKLMRVVENATGLWNVCERKFADIQLSPEWVELGDALRELGLAEAKP